jgi:hypothetical protein
LVSGRLGLPLPGVAVGAPGDSILVSPDSSTAIPAEIELVSGSVLLFCLLILWRSTRSERGI